MRQLVTAPALAAALLVAACDKDAPESEEPTGAEPTVDPAEAAAEAAGVPGFQAWDANQDNRIDPTEFQGHAKQVIWSQWDADDDGIVTEAEFVAGLHALFDADDDGLISDTEWNERAEPWLEAHGGVGIGDFSKWDADDVDGIGPEEFQAGWTARKVGAHGAWDADTSGGLDDVEWGRGWFDAWDADTSGYLDEDELGYWQ